MQRGGGKNRQHMQRPEGRAANTCNGAERYGTRRRSEVPGPGDRRQTDRTEGTCADKSSDAAQVGGVIN